MDVKKIGAHMIIEDKKQKETISTEILNKLPDWFGLPESTKKYIEESKKLPFFAYQKEHKALGFLSLKKTSEYTAEIYCMGVVPECHRMGIGKDLFNEAEQYAKENGSLFLQVKTVETGHYDEYDRTNEFYRSMGFKELEVLPLWDEWNPCQVYVKAI